MERAIAIKTAISLLAMVFFASGCNSNSSSNSSPDSSIAGIEVVRSQGFKSVVRIEAEDQIFLRYGNRAFEKLKRRTVLNYIEEGSVSEFTGDIGNLVGINVDVGESEYGSSYSLLGNDEYGIFWDEIKLPDGQKLIEIGGGEFVSFPKGEVTYKQIIHFVTHGFKDINEWENSVNFGVFEIMANFDTGAGNFRGKMPTRQNRELKSGKLDGFESEVEFVIDPETGEFESDQLIVKNIETERTYEAVLFGNFHGENARSVTGLFADINFGRFYGLFAGNKKQ